MAMTDYLAEKLLNHVFRSESYMPPETVYIALFTTAPAKDGSGTEVVGGSYEAQPVTFSLAENPEGKISNDIVVTWPNMPECSVVGSATMDAADSGNMLTFDAFSEPRIVTSGENLSMSVADLNIYFD